MPNTYTAIDQSEQRIDPGQHQVVRIENPLLAHSLIVTAHHAPDRMTWKQAKVWAAKLDLFGWSWRLPTVEEAFFIPDRARYPATPKEFFPDLLDGEWIWTGTVDAEDPEDTPRALGYAWGVGLSFGNSIRNLRSLHNRVRAVRAGQ